jgi:hypothetical protein
MVAYDRSHHDRSTTGGDTLKETRCDEDTDARTCGTGKRGQRIDRKATDQHAAAAKSVGQRPDDDLPRGVAEKIEAQRARPLRRGSRQMALSRTSRFVTRDSRRTKYTGHQNDQGAAYGCWCARAVLTWYPARPIGLPSACRRVVTRGSCTGSSARILGALLDVDP